MNDTIKNPYLSIVIASRNDEHGGNPLQRTLAAFNGLLTQLEKYYIESELILIDWNPPADKPLLKDVIKWPDKLRYCTIRVITVPASIHLRYEYSDIIPMNAVVAVNCGIRRACGQFILPSVIDLLYSDELMSYIAARGLKEDERYRVDRCDVDRNVVQCSTLKEQLDYSRKNIIKINSHQRNGAKNGLPDLHTNACGDFQLMSRRYWHLLRGYREADIATSYVDGLLSYASYAAGVKEVILAEPMRIYHIDHGEKFSDRMETSKLPLENWLLPAFRPTWLRSKLTAAYRRFLALVGYKMKSTVYGVPTLGYTEYRKMCRDIVTGKRSYIFNDENWGLAKESLEEFLIVKADWDKGYGKDK